MGNSGCVCGTACNSPSITMEENALLRNNTQRYVGPTLCRAFSALLGIQSPKEGTFTSLLAFHFGDQSDQMNLPYTLKSRVLGPFQHMPMTFEGLHQGNGPVAFLHHPAHAEIHLAVTLWLLPWPTLLGNNWSLCSQDWRNASGAPPAPGRMGSHSWEQSPMITSVTKKSN